MSGMALGATLWALVGKYWLHRTVTGWTAIVVMMSVFASAQFLMLGILGEYVGRIYEQVKGRPLYVVRDVVNPAGAPGTLDGAPRRG